MYQIRIHSRGGQGGKTAAQVLAQAAYYEGKYSQAFAIYGAERRGSPVAAFVRIDDKPILERGYIEDPDAFIVLDDSLLAIEDEIGLEKGLNAKDYFIINTCKKIKMPRGVRVVTVDATTIALQELGKPIVNTAMLGAFVKSTNYLRLSSVEKAIEKVLGKKHPELASKNINAIRKCYNLVKV